MRIRIEQDVKSLSEFRANTAACVDQVQQSRRPLVLTQHGKSAAVLLSAAEYDRMLDEIDLLREVRVAEGQLREGNSVDNEDARKQVLQALGE
jgi:antitoxin YefM